MTKLNKTYSIGLDIGNTSVGWSVVDEDYNILKFKKRNMWGVRLFDEGKTAANRRIARTARRRIQRRKERISLLKRCIGKMVIDVDQNFFMRLEKGCLTTDDKGYLYNLFVDDEFNDKKYYEQFETIYHLRKHLSTADEKADPRLIYLALHHIVKYRGNFLYEGVNFDVSNNSQIKETLKNALTTIFFEYPEITENMDALAENSLQILADAKLKRGLKKDNVIQVFVDMDKESKKIITEFVNLLLGYESNLTKLFSEHIIQKDDKDYKTNFSSTRYEDDIDFIESSLQDDFEVITLLHSVYSYIVLQDVLMGHNTICDAMIERYEKHKHDLEKLKKCIKTYGTLELYNKVLRNKNEKGNYYSYINNAGTTSKVELYAFLKKQLEANSDIASSDIYQSIKEDIDNENFLPKQNSKENSVIPYQMHELELVKILEKQAKFYPILMEEKEHIISLFKFRIPYYVGPLNDHSSHAWIKRNKQGKILPWNFEEKVDVLASAEQFIRKMTNCCTYLLTAPVLPKKSLVYTKYEVLNELNKIRINGKLIPTDIKMAIFNEVFLVNKKVKKKDIEAFYVRKQLSDLNSELEIKGFQKENEFASSLESWRDFKSIYGETFENNLEEIETLIEWITVYEDKKILKKRIEKVFPSVASDPMKMKKILKLRYTGWGRLSKELLSELKVKDKSDVYVSIMDCLEQTNMNFMQIINDKEVDFKHAIENYNMGGDTIDHIAYDQIAALQGSPAIKKGIWQTVQIVDEIVSIMGHEPNQIYVEFARSDEEKKRTQSKVKKLQDIYSLQQEDGYKDHEFIQAFQELKKLDKNAKLDSDRLTLYFIQQGKCMYTGKPLDISKLHLYQIDHILPQSFIKDDSIENKALVVSIENQNKGDNMLISPEIRKRQFGWWNFLLEKKLIGEKKFKNLTKAYITEKEELGFINRQLVETRQITKHVANLFKMVYSNTNIVSIKASLSSEFRKKFNLYKIRELNDYHHAQDAYLACVIGTFVLRKFPFLRKEFIFTQYDYLLNYKKETRNTNSTKLKYGFILNSIGDEASTNKETGEVVWEGTTTITKIRKCMNYKDCFITKKVEEKKGKLFEATIDSLDDLINTIDKTPHKVVALNKQRNDITKYGGFTSLKKAYGIAVVCKVKNKVKKQVLDIPRILANASSDKIIDYLKQETGSNDILIIKEKVLYNQLFEYEGGLYTMASASEWHNARQLILSEQSKKILYNLFHNKNEKPTSEELVSVYDEYLEKVRQYYPLLKGVHEKLLAQRENFINLEDKTKIMKELLNMTKANKDDGNLEDGKFVVSKRAGRMSKKVLDITKAVFIFQSITGMFEQRYKL